MLKFGIAMLMVMSSAAFAQDPLVCFSDDARRELTVTFDGTDKPTAQLTYDGQPVQFGDLLCQQDGDLVCRSHGVADAGYNAVITAGTKGHVVQLGEIWIGGERPLGLMTCNW